jgi:hypothetical protein
MNKATIPKQNILGSSPVKDGFCSSETEHDGRVALRTKLIVVAKR